MYICACHFCNISAFFDIFRYMRRDYFCLGTFPLNITNIPTSKLKIFPKEFYKFLSLFVKKSHFLDITLENLNELALVPK